MKIAKGDKDQRKETSKENSNLLRIKLNVVKPGMASLWGPDFGFCPLMGKGEWQEGKKGEGRKSGGRRASCKLISFSVLWFSVSLMFDST